VIELKTAWTACTTFPVITQARMKDALMQMIGVSRLRAIVTSTATMKKAYTQWANVNSTIRHLLGKIA
jgi:hypothetical protein